MSKVELYCGDCLEILPTLEAGSVDAIITDLPYGITACAFDVIIPFAPMWSAIKRVLKPRGVFITTASQPFTSKLVMSNLEWFKYEWIWEKNKATGHLDARRKPMRAHENICVFCGETPQYNPQLTIGDPYTNHHVPSKQSPHYSGGDVELYSFRNSGTRFPRSVQKFKSAFAEICHPTQKPVSLYEYLILTYTHPGELVVDIAAGSGTTGAAAIKTGRDCILIEKRPDYFEIVKQRIAKAQQQPSLLYDTGGTP